MNEVVRMVMKLLVLALCVSTIAGGGDNKGKGGNGYGNGGGDYGPFEAVQGPVTGFFGGGDGGKKGENCPQQPSNCRWVCEKEEKDGQNTIYVVQGPPSATAASSSSSAASAARTLSGHKRSNPSVKQNRKIGVAAKYHGAAKHHDRHHHEKRSH